MKKVKKGSKSENWMMMLYAVATVLLFTAMCSIVGSDRGWTTRQVILDFVGPIFLTISVCASLVILSATIYEKKVGRQAKKK